MAQGCIVYVEANKEIPEEVGKKLLTDFPDQVGVAFNIEGSAGVAFQQNVAPTWENISAMRKSCLEVPMVMGFFKHSEEFHEDDSQPYLLAMAEDNDEVQLAIFMEGDFTPHAMENIKREPAYFAYLNVLQPRIEQLYRLCRGDLNLVMEELDDKLIKKEFSDCVSDRGEIVLVPSVGDPVRFSISNENVVMQDWGWASNLKLPEEPKKQEAVVVAEHGVQTVNERLQAFSTKRTTKKKEPITSVAEVPEKKEEKKEVVHTTPKLPLQAEPPKAVPFQAAPPLGLGSNKTKKWYKQNCGFVPSEWHDRPSVTILSQRVTAVKKELGFLEDKKTGALKSLTALGTIFTGKPAVPDTTKLSEFIESKEKEKAAEHPDVKNITEDTFKKNTEPEHIKSSSVLSVNSLNYLQKEFLTSPLYKKWKEGSPPSLQEIIHMEDKLPNFYEATGMQIEKPWSEAMITDLMMKAPDAARLLISTLILEKCHRSADKALERQFTEATSGSSPPAEVRRTTKKKLA